MMTRFFGSRFYSGFLLLFFFLMAIRSCAGTWTACARLAWFPR